MTGADFLALLPHLVLTGAVVALLLVISFWRHHRAIALFSCAALVATLAAIVPALGALPRLVTPLLALDRYGMFLVGLFAAAALVVTVLSYRYLTGRRGDMEEYYLLLLTATLGAMTLAVANHFAAFLLGLEVLSIALYVLVAYPEEGQPPLEASLKYLILSGVASTTLLFGMALIFAASGSLEFSSVVAAPEAPRAELYLALGNLLVLAGVGFKVSLVPFHMWTPDVYEGAPAPISGYLATVSKGAVFAVAVRYLADSGALGNAAVLAAVTVVAILSMIVGNVLALLQSNVKRILAYSSIAHFGYLLIPLITLAGVDQALAVETTLLYLGAYFVMTLAAFGIVTVLSASANGRDTDDLESYRGLFWRRPLLAAVFTTALLSLAGIPMTVGFIAKFYLFAAGVEGELWLLLWALIVGSGVGIFYYLRIVFAMTREGVAEAPAMPNVSAEGQWTLGVLGALMLVFGIHPAPFIEAVNRAIELLGG